MCLFVFSGVSESSLVKGLRVLNKGKKLRYYNDRFFLDGVMSDGYKVFLYGNLKTFIVR